jgi:hypothetical protein
MRILTALEEMGIIETTGEHCIDMVVARDPKILMECVNINQDLVNG